MQYTDDQNAFYLEHQRREDARFKQRSSGTAAAEEDPDAWKYCVVLMAFLGVGFLSYYFTQSGPPKQDQSACINSFSDLNEKEIGILTTIGRTMCNDSVQCSCDTVTSPSALQDELQCPVFYLEYKFPDIEQPSTPTCEDHCDLFVFQEAYKPVDKRQRTFLTWKGSKETFEVNEQFWNTTIAKSPPVFHYCAPQPGSSQAEIRAYQGGSEIQGAEYALCISSYDHIKDTFVQMHLAHDPIQQFVVDEINTACLNKDGSKRVCDVLTLSLIGKDTLTSLPKNVLGLNGNGELLLTGTSKLIGMQGIATDAFRGRLLPLSIMENGTEVSTTQHIPYTTTMTKHCCDHDSLAKCMLETCGEDAFQSLLCQP